MGAKKLYYSKIAANGQMVLPKELREALDLSGGEVLNIIAEDRGGGVIIVTIQRPRKKFTELIGLLSLPEGGKSTDWEADLKRLDDEEMK